MNIDIDSDRLQRWIDELAAFSEAPAPAVTRVLFSDVDLARARVGDRALRRGRPRHPSGRRRQHLRALDRRA